MIHHGHKHKCSISSGLSLILNPINTIEDFNISENVWVASATGAEPPEKVPIIKLKIARIEISRNTNNYSSFHFFSFHQHPWS